MPFAQSEQFMFQICIVDTRVEDLLTVCDEKISHYLMMFVFCESVFYTLYVCELLYVHMFAVKVPIQLMNTPEAVLQLRRPVQYFRWF